MAYRLKQGRRVDDDVRRIADQQLALAIRDLRRVGDPRANEAVQEARRHLKKTRALIGLASLRPRRSSRGADIRLRDVNRMLAPIADGEALLDTLMRMNERYEQELPRQTFLKVRRLLLRQRARARRRAKAGHVLRAGTAILRAERRRAGGWRVSPGGFRALEPGLERCVRRARRGMRRALEHPTVETYHTWRRRTKQHWLQVRLLEGRCAGALASWERTLAELDERLGEHHNCALLAKAITADNALSRDEAVLVLRLVRRFQCELRAQARRLGAGLYGEPPREFVRRVKHLWRAAGKSARHATPPQSPDGTREWPRAA
jgi:hypothetical protein